ncbi:hypothetical protein [Demequina muriae]|uniref:Primosomal protein N' 3' DNA-binding domain-containing protein n=1 Tax=Demequina muriae TaxID=3051664 RepID=A0ABT8GJV3_9MICO|nr:hypothetical protein [Demequina sp. EGI L300058]MDN4481700.1 hypothetical protein [Demequina sp. EGI L300058]
MSLSRSSGSRDHAGAADRVGGRRPPIASVRLDSPLPHLDRPFDYAIPPTLVSVVEIGSRVRVPFAGRLVSGVVTRLPRISSFAGSLSTIRSASAIPSYTPAAITLADRIARRYGGSVWDVLRLMAPPRAAAIEKRDWDSAPVALDADYAAAMSRSSAEPLAREGERVVWEALPDDDPRTSVAAARLIATAVVTAATGASSIVVAPDARAVAALLAECRRLGLSRWTARSGGAVAVLDHDDGPAVRFGSYVAAMRGHARIVIGTRPVAMQPVPHLGVIAVWDEANGALEDLHAPYPHARTVASMRAEEGAGLVLGGYAPSADAIALVEHGWARLEAPSRDAVRAAVPAVDVMTAERRDAEGGAGWHWMPGSVWRAVRAALAEGPVAIVVPRAGYVSATACARCEQWAECRECSSLLGLASPGADPVCLDQGHVQTDWHCPECQGSQLKHVRQGADRIAEQLRRMLGDVPLTVSTSSAGIVDDHTVTEGVVLATPAALPAVAGGYRHLVVTDAGVPAGTGLGGELKAIRWWLGAAALVRGRPEGGAVTIVGEVPPAVRRALSTWSPGDAARDEYQERSALGLPPHRRYVTVHGDRDGVREALAHAGVADEPSGSTTWIELQDGVGILLPRSQTQAIVDALRDAQREASKAKRELRIRVDGPLELPR